MGLHICAVVQRGSGSPKEYVEVVNDGAEPVPVMAVELTDCWGEQHNHVYSFPEGELGAGEIAYVYTSIPALVGRRLLASEGAVSTSAPARRPNGVAGRSRGRRTVLAKRTACEVA